MQDRCVFGFTRRQCGPMAAHQTWPPPSQARMTMRKARTRDPAVRLRDIRFSSLNRVVRSFSPPFSLIHHFSFIIFSSLLVRFYVSIRCTLIFFLVH